MRHGSHGTSSSATKTHQKKNATRKKKHLYLKYTNQVVLYIYISTIIYIQLYIIYIYIIINPTFHQGGLHLYPPCPPRSQYIQPWWPQQIHRCPRGFSPTTWLRGESSRSGETTMNQWRFLDFWRNYDELHLDLFQWRFLEKLWWILQMNYI